MDNFDFITIGAKVYWKDPAIAEFDPKDRKIRENTIWTIDLIDGIDGNVEVNEDSIILISDSLGAEAEVFPDELILV